MQQKELAQLLDISPAMVSRLAKRGMPTDTLERAERWRKRHLEPGRVKGSRFGTVLATPAPSQPRPAPDAVVPALEAAALLIDAALLAGNAYGAAIRTNRLRVGLRAAGECIEPCFSVGVWLALTDYVLHPEAEIRNTKDTGERLTPGQYGRRVSSAITWPAAEVLFQACDYDDCALNGWPDDLLEDDEELDIDELAANYSVEDGPDMTGC